MQIEAIAWMVRDLGERPSSILITSTHLVVGGWDGRLTCWHLDGESVWSVQLPDRIQEIIFAQTCYFVNSGLFVINIDAQSGVENWRVETEGSADYLIFNAANNQVVATSSVYDIEHGDFMESAVWFIDSESGEVNNCERFDERPWHLSLKGDVAVMGLGRPRGGLLLVGNESKWQALAGTSPVTCGIVGRQHQLFGHADGLVSLWANEKATPLTTFDATIEQIICTPKGFLVALESGVCVACDEDGSELWQVAVEGQIIAADNGFQIRETETVWLLYRDESSGELVVCSDDGTTAAQFNLSSTPTALMASKTHSAIATADGNIYLFEGELFNRRLETLTDNKPTDSGATDKRREMMAKLRKLRGG